MFNSWILWNIKCLNLFSMHWQHLIRNHALRYVAQLVCEAFWLVTKKRSANKRKRNKTLVLWHESFTYITFIHLHNWISRFCLLEQDACNMLSHHRKAKMFRAKRLGSFSPRFLNFGVWQLCTSHKHCTLIFIYIVGAWACLLATCVIIIIIIIIMIIIIIIIIMHFI